MRAERATAARPAMMAGIEVSALSHDLGKMIESARQNVAAVANAALTTIYWELGHRAQSEVLEERRAACGTKTVAARGDNWGRATVKVLEKIFR